MIVLVMAKSPVPGRVKTRLCPPLTPVQAAEVARAALADTLAAVAGCAADRRVVALDGEPGPWLPTGFRVVPQRGRGFSERLANAWSGCDGPTLQIGMDTPQLDAARLDAALDLLLAAPGRAVLGPCADGGWWGLGMREPRPDAFDGVPMSEPTTRTAQVRRLRELGLRPTTLPELVDVDTWTDALGVAAQAPNGAFGGAVERLSVPELAGARSAVAS